MLKIVAIGNLTSNVTLKTNETTGKPYAMLRLASDRRYKTRDGLALTDYISVKATGFLAERCAEFAWKGCLIAAAGDLETVAPDDPTQPVGFFLRASEVQFLSSRRDKELAAAANNTNENTKGDTA